MHTICCQPKPLYAIFIHHKNSIPFQVANNTLKKVLPPTSRVNFNATCKFQLPLFQFIRCQCYDQKPVDELIWHPIGWVDMPFHSAVGVCLMSGSVKGTAVSYYHRSLRGAIHRRQAVKPCAERLQLHQLLQGWFVSLTCPGKAQYRAVTLRNQERGRTEAEQAMCYLESRQSHHHLTVADNAHLFKFIISVCYAICGVG